MTPLLSRILGRASTPEFPSLLKDCGPAQVVPHPFPHLILPQALPEALYRELESSFPDETRIRAGKHVANRDQLMAADLLNDRTISPAWRAFVRTHTSRNFYLDLLRVFRPWVELMYPWLPGALKHPLEQCSVGLRDSRNARLPDVCLDCQPGLNTVTLDPATPRTSHLDAANKLFTGLLYMRLPEDAARGGDFLLHRPRGGGTPRFDTPSTALEEDLEVAATVPYRANTAVFFMNSPLSLHGVSVRGGTPIPRRLVNLVAGLYTLPGKELFPLPPTPSDMDAARQRLG